ncbi:hypothetical protein CKJ81_05290 [Corynebacterium hadale]|uniref:Glycosyl transferase family 1 domain-containing protein n=1 Tax=Corynebacterium hadale TaxID=2026255 RepID=A0ABX4HAK4_9CORY|nr:hypothetical protein CKJ81_05290 [Corynebacterium hadale]
MRRSNCSKPIKRALLLGSVVFVESTTNLPAFLKKIFQRFSLARFVQFPSCLNSASEPKRYRSTHDIIPSCGWQDSRVTRISYYVTNSFPQTVSGYSVRTHGVAKGLLENGLEVEVVTRLGYPLVIGKGILSEESFVTGGVAYRRLLPKLYPRNARRAIEKEVELLVSAARKHGAQFLLTTTDYKNAVVTSHAAFQLQIPWGYEIRGERENTWLSAWSSAESATKKAAPYYVYASRMERVAEASAALCIVLSSIAQRRLLSDGIAAENLFVIPNSIGHVTDDQDLADKVEIRKKLGIDNDYDFVIGTVSSLVDYEGVDLLIDYAAKSNSRCLVVVVGDGTSRRSLENRASQLGVESRVRFVGAQDPSSIQNWYRSFDVFALTRKATDVTKRVTPIKATEAFNQRVPVVASRLPAVEEATGGWAHYYAPEDLESFERAVANVLDSGPPSSMEFSRWLKSRTWSSSTQQLANELKREK